MSFMDSTVNANLLSSLKITFKSITEYLISKKNEEDQTSCKALSTDSGMRRSSHG